MRFLGPALVAALLFALPASADRVVTHSGRTLDHVAPGERIVVRLTECAPCGYAWRVAARHDRDVVRRVASRYVDTSDGTTVGGAGKRVITYRGVRPGSTTVRLRYVGPDGTVAKRFSMRVNVTAR